MKQASYCGYSNTVSPGMWSGGIVGHACAGGYCKYS
ncbi:hypothetical protein IMSAGC012_02405 [Lachnospiraceae bacterium]|nr:hypothetical protein IMSAGC012_02405 [Lachnospiraceae bacterium]